MVTSLVLPSSSAIAARKWKERTCSLSAAGFLASQVSYNLIPSLKEDEMFAVGVKRFALRKSDWQPYYKFLVLFF